MKRFLQILTIGFAMGLVLLGISSCADDKAIVNGVDDNENIATLRLSFAKEGPNIDTRALPEEGGDRDLNELKIERLHAFFYEGNILRWRVCHTELSYDDQLNVATFRIPPEKLSLFRNNTNIQYDIYVVANNTAVCNFFTDDENNLDEMKNLLVTTNNLLEKSGKEAQPNFVMDGKYSGVINLNDLDLGKIKMKRAASKIRLRMVEVNVPGFFVCPVCNITARLVHFTNKTTLMQGGSNDSTFATDAFKNTDFVMLTTEAPLGIGGGLTTAAPFYAYSNNWQIDPTRETYLELSIPLVRDGTTTIIPYDYRIPLTPKDLTGEMAQYMNRLDRNFIYDIAVKVRVVGSVAGPPVEIEGNYKIKDWATEEVLVSFEDAKYLVVSENEVLMPNIDTYTLTFSSSESDVTVKENSLKVSYFNPVVGGGFTEVDITTKGIVDVNVTSIAKSGSITINSPIPTNYFSRYIEFIVTNGMLEEKVKITQLPQTYFTFAEGVKSSVYPDGNLPNDATNPFVYRLNTIAPSGEIIWGFPPLDAHGRTINTEEVSKMVSPRFELASVYGGRQLFSTYGSAQQQCKGYSETIKDENGEKLREDWRLPTAAEIRFIDKVQQYLGTSSAQALGVMRGRYYWSSWDDYPTIHNNVRSIGAYRMGVGYESSTSVQYVEFDEAGTIAITANNAPVRCVRDIK